MSKIRESSETVKFTFDTGEFIQLSANSVDKNICVNINDQKITLSSEDITEIIETMEHMLEEYDVE